MSMAQMMQAPQGLLAAEAGPNLPVEMEDPQAESEEVNLDDPAYKAALKEARSRLYSKEVAEGLAKSLLYAPDVATGIADQTKALLEATDQLTEGTVPDELYMMLGIELMGDVAEMAEAAGLSVTGTDLVKAMRQFMLGVIEDLGGDVNDLNAAMSQIDPQQAGGMLDQLRTQDV